MKIGVIGQGFVGSAIKNGLQKSYEVLTYDIVEEKANATLETVCRDASIIFTCIPTPMRVSGECDTRLLEKVIDNIDRNRKNNTPIVVIKSTVPPGTTDRISKNYNFPICFSPEFLTEANSFEDFKNQTRIIIGGPRPATGKIKQMFRKVFPEIPIVKTGTKTAEMVKYFTNCFLATKVTFGNQMYQICKESDVDYDKVCEYALYDKRIGNTHLAVPGPDGDFGYGGHCFPKDLSAMIYFAKNADVNPSLFEEVKSFNTRIRSNRDWEEMKGRAISDD